MSNRNEARLLHDWSGRSTMSYREHLQSREYERSIRYEIEDQGSRIIATTQQLAERGFSRLESATNAGFSELSEQMASTREAIDIQSVVLSRGLSTVEDAVRESAEEISAAIYWGVGEILGQLDVLDDSLQELIKLAKTPSQVWAYEQFDIARDEYNRCLFPEALDSVTRAISGYGTFTGYRSDFRFHALLGEIRIGRHDNYSPNVVDVAAAEEAFVNASRYALSSDKSFPAGHALIAAGRAAFLQGENQRAVVHTTQGLQHCPLSAQAHYQLARALAALEDDASAALHLTKAFVLSPRLSVGALGEDEFYRRPELLSRSAIAATDELTQRYSALCTEYDEALEAVAALPTFDVDIAELRGARLRGHSAIIRLSQAAADTGTLLGAADACQILRQDGVALMASYNALQQAVTEGLKRENDALAREREKLGDQYQRVSQDIAKSAGQQSAAAWVFFGILFTIVGWVIVIILFFRELGQPQDGMQTMRALWHGILHALLTPFIAFPIGFVAQLLTNAIPAFNIGRSETDRMTIDRSRRILDDQQQQLDERIRRASFTYMPDALGEFSNR